MSLRGGYQPITSTVKDDNGDMPTDFHILNRWKKYFSQLLNVDRVSEVRQIKIHTTEPLVPDPSAFETETAIAKGEKF
jgi:hypothetical protein